MAATTHLRALADERLVGAPGRRRALAVRIATPGYRDELARRLDAAYQALEAGWPAGTPIVFRAHPLGYRIEHRSAGRATVAVWSAVVHPGEDGTATVAWTLSRAAVRRTAAGWRLERYLPDEPGPAPASAAPATPAAEFAAITATLSPYRR
ncbi:hypothetical protein [Miltoncostaea marina]|uniref:hypothetical protein n=1 Tax=Miltoncostaea marina TaxID=2843215 RepID=UPI001C3DB9B3|nr:hypothetical protein [Miltoncostaea marina]